MFHIFHRPTLAVVLRRWAKQANLSAQDFRHDALSLRAQAELFTAKAKGADAIADMYEAREHDYLQQAEIAEDAAEGARNGLSLATAQVRAISR